jgi:hypothetical protein
MKDAVLVFLGIVLMASGAAINGAEIFLDFHKDKVPEWAHVL